MGNGLSFNIFESMWQYVVKRLPDLAFALLIFIAGWVLAKYLTKLIMRFIERSRIDTAAEYFFRSFILVVFRMLVILITLSQLGVDVTTIITAVGAATITVGLALQDTLGNIASGILLIFTHPFKEGDYLKIGDDEGTVTKIALFSTHINTLDNKNIIIPNKNIISKSVINFSSNEDRRVDLAYRLSYDNDLPKAKSIARNIIRREPLTIRENDMIIGIFSQSDIYVTLDVKFWCKNQDYWDLYYKIQEQINVAFEENGIKAPYYTVVHKDGTISEKEGTYIGEENF